MNEKEKIFISILERHKGIIYKVANTYCYNKYDQDDLIQEITLHIWQSIEKFDDQYKWSTWIYRIALNTSISYYRKSKALKRRTVNLDPIIETSTDSNESMEEEKVTLLRKFIQEFKELDKGLILLHLDGLSSKEIANIIGITPTNVTTKISRIKKKLKEKFKNHKN